MKVRLIIHSALKNFVDGYQDNGGLNKEISEPKTIEQFLRETIQHEKAMDAISMVLVNEEVIPFQQLKRILKDGDTIKVYPPMGGG